MSLDTHAPPSRHHILGSTTLGALALTLASDDHPFMTAAQIVLDGGKTAKAG